MLRTAFAAIAIAGTIVTGAVGAVPIASADTCAYGSSADGRCKAETPEQTKQRLQYDRDHRVLQKKLVREFADRIINKIKHPHPHQHRQRGLG